MKAGIISLFLALPTTVIFNSVNVTTKVEQKNQKILKAPLRSEKLKNLRSDLLWYVERHGYGWTPFYSIDFTRKFFVNAIDYLQQMSWMFNFWKSINEKNYNEISGGKFSEHALEISSQLSTVEIMSIGYFAGIAVTGPMCLDLKNRFWNTWDPIFSNIEKSSILELSF